MTSESHKVEVYSAGCPVCSQTISLVEKLACDSCDVRIRDMTDPTVAEQARKIGIRSVPAIVIDGKLAACCVDRGPDEASLTAAGLGQSI